MAANIELRYVLETRTQADDERNSRDLQAVLTRNDAREAQISKEWKDVIEILLDREVKRSKDLLTREAQRSKDIRAAIKALSKSMNRLIMIVSYKLSIIRGIQMLTRI